MSHLYVFVTLMVLSLHLLTGCDSDGNSTDGSSELDEDDSESGLSCAVSDWGPYGTGIRTFDVVDSSREDRPIPALVIYPTLDRPDYEQCERDFFKTDASSRYLASAVCARPDAEPDRQGAPFPVIFLSHGCGSLKEGYTYLEEFFASHGFVVVALDHTGNVGPKNYFPADPAMSFDRLLDVRLVITRMVEAFADPGSPLHSIGDPDSMGIVGHSWGGHTAVVLAGMEYSYEKIQSECEQGTTLDEYACPLLDHRAEIEEITPDPRLRAVVSWAQDIGQSKQVAGPNCAGAPGVTIPWLTILGDRDSYLVVQEDGWDCYANAGGEACLVLLRGAGHMGYTDLGDEINMDDARMLHLVSRYSTGFFLQHLTGNDRCGTMIEEQASSDGTDHEFECRDHL